MKVLFKKLKIEKHKNWRAYWSKELETKEQSLCIMEFDPGVRFEHIHLLGEGQEIEIVLEGEGRYSGAIKRKVKPGDLIEQKGKSDLIVIENTGKTSLRILCINRPPWQKAHETILTD